MRAPLEPRFDPSRPNAQSVSGRVVQTTLITPEDLAKVQITLDGSRVRVSSQASDPSVKDEDRMMHILCAVVVRSGYAWQPVLFGDGR